MSSYGNPKPTMGISQNQTSTPGSQPGRPGTITRGPGGNKPRRKGHLVASKGKVSAEIYAQAVARMQAVGHKTPPAGHDPTVQEASRSTAVGTAHVNPTGVNAPQRKELTKEYKKMVGLRVDGRNSKQRVHDAGARLNNGA